MKNGAVMLCIAIIFIFILGLSLWKNEPWGTLGRIFFTDRTIIEENKKPGSNKWKITNPAGNYLQGYASKPSAQAGDMLSFYVHSEEEFRVEVYRMGYYNGFGGRLVYREKDLSQCRQTMPPEGKGCEWSPAYRIQIPASWTSGFYLSKLIDAKGREGYIPFIVKEKDSYADYAVLLATNTYQAYNNWGGKSLYAYNSVGRKQGTVVSSHRPYTAHGGSGGFFQFEYNLVRWMEKEGYSLTYISDMDVHKGILEQSRAKALLIAGHAEYWSMEMRRSIEKITASKMNLANFSSNVGYWQVRIHSDIKNPDHSLMVSYKESAIDQDPLRFTNPKLVTTKFRDKPVSLPEDRVLGTMYIGIPSSTVPMVVTNPNHWLYKGIGVKRGDQIAGVIGGEVDGFNGLPGGEVVASSPAIVYRKKQHAAVVWYNKPTGTKAFSVGTFYWNWFLDPIHHEKDAQENKWIQQITRNALKQLAI